MSRVLVRAGIPMWYTKGFNPHAKVIFGLPLSVGTESECEFIDLRVDRDISGEEVKDRLNRCLTDEMQVIEAYETDTKFNDITWASYEMELNLENADADMAERLQSLWTTAPLTVTKKTKSGDKEIDIIPMIRSVCVRCTEPGHIHVSTMLAAGNTEHLNPELLITAAKRECGILSGNPAKESYSILRTHVYLADGETEFR
jgi:radical SAM-linked protein